MPTRSRTRKTVARWWGYGVFAATVYFLIDQSLPVAVLAGGAVLSSGYFLFGAPLWCAAPVRAGGGCRNNAHGLLLGCHLEQHKWAKLRMLVKRSEWAQLVGRVTYSVAGRVAAAGGAAACVTAVVTVLILLLGDDGLWNPGYRG